MSARLRYHASNSVVFLHRAGTLAKEYPLSKLFSKVEPWPFEKEININLVYSSCLKHANEMLLGDPRQSDQRTQSFHFPIVVHQSLNPAAQSSAQAPSSFTCLYKVMHFEVRALDRLRTRRRVGSTRRRGNHMHDHSRFQRDINDVTGVSLSLYLSQKSLTHNIGSASALPIITACRSLSQNAQFSAGMSTRQIPPQLTHGATLPYRLNVLHVIVVTFSMIVAYQ